MTKLLDLDAIDAARELGALSPQTQRRFDECMALGLSGPLQVTQAFRAIGAAIGSKREPVSSENKKRLLEFAEQLLNHGSDEVMNAVATCMLQQIWRASQSGGFDFGEVDPYLGPVARRYLIDWDNHNDTKTGGLRRI